MLCLLFLITALIADIIAHDARFCKSELKIQSLMPLFLPMVLATPHPTQIAFGLKGHFLDG
jgi:hypothetical protein